MFEKIRGNEFLTRKINELAENLLNEGDVDSLKEMARRKTGSWRNFVAMYKQGGHPDALRRHDGGPLGKIEVECEDLKPQEIMEGLGGKYIKAPVHGTVRSWPEA